MMTSIHYKRIAIFVTALLLTFHVLLLYALPDLVFLVVLGLISMLYSRMEGGNIAMVVTSLSIVTVMVVSVLKFTGLNHSIFYRPQEIFSVYDVARHHYRYEENVNFEMTVAHGDLKAFDARVASEPRHVLFQSDSYGFRNAKDFQRQQYIMVGDSFVAGNGISQENIITEQLRRLGVDSYNLAAPGRLNDYIRYISNFKKTYGFGHKFVLFLYEGNDFGHAHASPIPQLTGMEKIERFIHIRLDWYRKLWGIENTDIYRFMAVYIQRITYHEKVSDSKVNIQEINGMPVAFYKQYVLVTRRKVVPEFLNFEKIIAPVRKDIIHIFFIPTKYRVYYKHLKRLNPCFPDSLPDRQWEYIQSVGDKLGIKTTNLTPALIQASDILLSSKKLSYWKGDTHWNKYGIATAAKVVAEQLAGER